MIRFYHLSVAELAALDEQERYQLQRDMIRIRARERLEQIMDLGALLSAEEARGDYILSLAESAFSDDEDALSRFYAAIKRRR